MTVGTATRNGQAVRPPHDTDAERALLGAMMLNRDAIGAAVEVGLDGADFYTPAHGLIYDAVTVAWAAGAAVDAVTVADHLRRAEVLEQVGGMAALVDLIGQTPSLGNAGRYAVIVEEMALLRRLAAAGQQITQEALATPVDVAGCVDTAEQIIFGVAERRVRGSAVDMRTLVARQLDHLEALAESKGVVGLATGFTDLDSLLGGLQRSSLVVLGARPSQGKTTLALNVAAHVASIGTPVLVFSLEMSHLELTQRLLCAEARIDAARMRLGRLSDADWQRLTPAVGRIAEWPVYIDDSAHLTVTEIRAKSRRIQSRYGIGLVVVDYLQLLSGRAAAENRQVEVSEISRGLKLLARELDCPVLALSQLSRNVEARVDKRPVLADLRESGSIEADADVVAFLYRDEVYHRDSPDRGTAEVIVAKHRNGPTGTTHLAFLAHCTRFADMAKEAR